MSEKISSKDFFDFIKLVGARELEYFICEANYTTTFNNNIKGIVDELIDQGKKSIEFMVLFNTKGEIALINEEIIGGYLGGKLIEDLRLHYRVDDINVLAEEISKKEYIDKQEFIVTSYQSICRILKEIYKDIKYRREEGESYKNRYSLNSINEEGLPISIASILVLEDICAYLSFDVELRDIIPQKIK